MPDPAPPRARSPLLLAGLGAALAAYAVLLWPHAYVMPGGSDSSGYFNVARLLAHGAFMEPIRAAPGLPPAELHPLAYAPLGFGPDPRGTNLLPTYPIGLPIFLLGFGIIFPAAIAAKLALLTHAVAGVWLVYLLARRLGAGRPAALVGTAAVAFSPLYLFFSLQAMSDVPALTWVTAAVWLALVSREKSGWAAGAGLAFGLAVLIRPSNAVLLLPLLIALGASWRRWLWFGLGGLPAAAVMAWFNVATYGKIFASGYSGLADMLELSSGLPTLAHYARWLPVVGTPLIVLALGFPWFTSASRRTALMLATWVLVFFGFYAFYPPTHETWWYLRYVLPALPALIIPAILVLEKLLARISSAQGRLAAYAVALVVAFSSNAWWNKHWAILSNTGEGEMIYAELSHWTQAHLPPDAVLITMQLSGAERYYTDFILIRWEYVGDSWPKIQAALAAAHRPVYATLFDFEEEPALKTAVPGRWEPVVRIRQGGVWRLRTGEP